jgi:hypothetical protein
VFKEQIMALGIVPSERNSTTKAFTDLKVELEKEKAAWEMAQMEVDMLARAVKDWKFYAGQFSAEIPILEEKVKHQENKVIDGLN